MHEGNVKQLSLGEWVSRLREDPALADRCDKWDEFRLVHWAKLIHGHYDFVVKMKELGKEKLIGEGWCCPNHWAEEYCSFFVRCAAASSREEKIRRIAEESAMNPEKSHHYTLPGDVVKRIQWLASVAADFAREAEIAASEVAARAEAIASEKDGETSTSIPSAWDAEEYALIAEAANYAIQMLKSANDL